MDLESRIKALEDWKRARETQQLTFPLDQKTVEIINNYFMRITGDLQSVGGGGGLDTSYIGTQADKEFLVTKNQFIPYSVDVGNDLIIPLLNFGLEEDQKMYFVTDNTFPGGISSGDYFAINVTANGFQITTVMADPMSIVNITDAGVGRQWLWSYGF